MGLLKYFYYFQIQFLFLLEFICTQHLKNSTYKITFQLLQLFAASLEFFFQESHSDRWYVVYRSCFQENCGFSIHFFIKKWGLSTFFNSRYFSKLNILRVLQVFPFVLFTLSLIIIKIWINNKKNNECELIYLFRDIILQKTYKPPPSSIFARRPLIFYTLIKHVF